MSILRDIDVRPILKRHLAQSLSHDSVFIDELPIPEHENRIDLAVVNGILHGFEIKSDADTLQRLPAQCGAYGSLFDEITLVCGEKHLRPALKIIPEWWGILLLVKDATNTEVRLLEYRQTFPNPHPDALTVVRLLWRREVESLVKELGLRSRTRHYYMYELNKLLVSEASIDELRKAARLALRSRHEAAARHELYDG